MVGSHGAPPHDAAWRALHRLCLPVSPCGLAALTRLTPGPVQSRVPTDHSKSLREDCLLTTPRLGQRSQTLRQGAIMSISRRHILGGALASLSLALTACSGASPDPSPAGQGTAVPARPATGSSAPWSRSSPPGPSGSESSATRPPSATSTPTANPRATTWSMRNESAKTSGRRWSTYPSRLPPGSSSCRPRRWTSSWRTSPSHQSARRRWISPTPT